MPREKGDVSPRNLAIVSGLLLDLMPVPSFKKICRAAATHGIRNKTRVSACLKELVARRAATRKPVGNNVLYLPRENRLKDLMLECWVKVDEERRHPPRLKIGPSRYLDVPGERKEFSIPWSDHLQTLVSSDIGKLEAPGREFGKVGPGVQAKISSPMFDAYLSQHHPQFYQRMRARFNQNDK